MLAFILIIIGSCIVGSVFGSKVGWACFIIAFAISLVARRR